jgi:hypothetical protein
LVSVAALKRSNPGLYDRLVQRWEEGRGSSEDPFDFRMAIGAKIDEAFAEWVRGGSYEVEAAYWRLVADRARSARKSGAEACDALLHGDSEAARMPPEIELRGRALIAQALLAPAKEVPTPRAATSTFAIPGRIAEATLGRSRLAPDRLAAALRGRGTAAERCDARIVLIEAALAQPKTVAAPFLRRMSATL